MRRDNPPGRQRQTWARSQHPPMETDGPADERMSHTPVPEAHVTNSRQSSDSHINNIAANWTSFRFLKWNQNTNDRMDKKRQTNKNNNNQIHWRAFLTLPRFPDHLLHQNNSAKSHLGHGLLIYKPPALTSIAPHTNIGKHSTAPSDLPKKHVSSFLENTRFFHKASWHYNTRLMTNTGKHPHPSKTISEGVDNKKNENQTDPSPH